MFTLVNLNNNLPTDETLVSGIYVLFRTLKCHQLKTGLHCHLVLNAAENILKYPTDSWNKISMTYQTIAKRNIKLPPPTVMVLKLIPIAVKASLKVDRLQVNAAKVKEGSDSLI
jgi:hypothetical protein